MPWTPLDENAPSFQINDANGNIIDISNTPLTVGVVYEYRVDITNAPTQVQMRALTEAEYQSQTPREQSHLLSVNAIVSTSDVTATFTPTTGMRDASPIRLGFVQDPTTLAANDDGKNAWGVGGIVVEVV